MTVQWQEVYIFISSTFNDMHAERDYLVKQVFPQLQEWCEKRKLRLLDIDLRWGVTEADATQNKRVVQVCLERVDSCRPFFLCFLGQRRGWVPGKNDISPETYAGYSELEKVAGTASVTEMEILHALISPLHNGRFLNKDGKIKEYQPTEHAFFYFRDPGYLQEMPADLPQLRQIYTNDGIADPGERQKADSEVQLWRQEVIPHTLRPIHPYSCHWEISENTNEIRMPLQCPTTAEFGSPNWQAAFRKWAAQWAQFDVQVSETGEIDDPIQVQKAEQANARLIHGRLGQFSCKDQSLADVILTDLKAGIEQRYPEHVEEIETTPLQHEINQQAQFLQMASEGFIERSNDFDTLDQYLNEKSDQTFVLTAPAGMGKTSMLARWIERSKLQQKPEPAIFSRFVGASNNSTRVESLLYSLLSEISIAYHASTPIPLDPEKLQKTWLILAAEMCQQHKLCIVIDSINQLETGFSNLQWLAAKLPEQIRLVISFKTGTSDAEEFFQYLKTTGRAHLNEVRPFDISDRKELVQVYLSRYLKELDEKLLDDLILQPGTENPLYLKIVISELRVFGSFQQLSEKINAFGGEPGSAFQTVLQRLEQDPTSSSVASKHVVPLIFGLLAVARHGLSISELTNMLVNQGINPEKFSSLEDSENSIRTYLRQMRAYISYQDGRFGLFYESLKLAVNNRYQSLQTRLHSELVREFTRRSDPASDHGYAGAENLALAELPYHLAGAGLEADLYALLSSQPYLNARCKVGNVYQILPDFAFLPQRTDTQSYYDFLYKNAQKISRYPNSFLSLLAFEGNEKQKIQLSQNNLENKWLDPWVNLQLMSFEEAKQTSAGPTLQVSARFDHERSCAVDTARLANLSFWVKNMGQVAIFNTENMQLFDQTLTTARMRPLIIRCSAHGTYLALAYDNGEAEIFRTAFDTDDKFRYQKQAGNLHYYLPEIENPVFWWDGNNLWYQVDEKKLARRIFTDENETISSQDIFYDLSVDLQGEVNLIFAHDEAVLIGSRQGDDTSLAVLVNNKFIPLEKHTRCDVTCFTYDYDTQTAAVAFSNQRVCIYAAADGIEIISKFTAPDTIKVLNINGKILYLITDRVAIYQTDIQSGSDFIKLVDEGHLSAKTIRVFAQSLLKRGSELLECTTDLGILQLVIASAGAKQTAACKELFSNLNGECMEVRVKGPEKELSLVDFSACVENTLSTNGGDLFVTGMDGEGDFFATHISGWGVFRSASGEIYNFKDLPPGGISLAGDARSGFWLGEENGNIYYIDKERNFSHTLFTQLKPLLPSGSALSVFPGYLIWKGISRMLDSTKPDAEGALALFKAEQGQLEYAGILPLLKSMGHFMCFAFDPTQQRFYIVLRIVGSERKIIRYGTFEELLANRGKEFELEVAHESFVKANFLQFRGRDFLLLLSPSGNLFVVDATLQRTIVSFCPQTPLTRLSTSINPQNSTYCAVNDTQIYLLKLELPL